MASPYRTGKLGEASMASPEIVQLAQDVLTQEEYERAIELSEMLVSSKSEKGEAIYELMKLVSPPPKRPMYYAQMEIRRLPRWTRDAIRYLGDYIDQLTKHLAYATTNDSKVKEFSMGMCLKAIGQHADALPEGLADRLTRYNSFLYRPGKHDFRLPEDRKSHRFTPREVVLTAFVTVKLAENIREIIHCAPELNCHYDK